MSVVLPNHLQGDNSTCETRNHPSISFSRFALGIRKLKKNMLISIGVSRNLFTALC